MQNKNGHSKNYSIIGCKVNSNLKISGDSCSKRESLNLENDIHAATLSSPRLSPFAGASHT